MGVLISQKRLKSTLTKSRSRYTQPMKNSSEESVPFIRDSMSCRILQYLYLQDGGIFLPVID